MIRKGIKCAGERIEDRLRRLCGAISPDKRIIAVVTLFVLFTTLSLYSTVAGIYRLGRRDGRRIRIEHIHRLDTAPTTRPDSLERLNTIDYERERERETEQ